jgi:hypothetical protein
MYSKRASVVYSRFLHVHACTHYVFMTPIRDSVKALPQGEDMYPKTSSVVIRHRF